MQKLLIGLLMTLFSSLSHAEWLAVSEGDKGAAYIDLDRIVQEKDNIKVWVLLNYKEDQEENVGGKKIVFKSVMSHTEFECKKRLYKEGAIHYFSGSMGQDKSVHKEFGGAWFDACHYTQVIHPEAPGQISARRQNPSPVVVRARSS